MFYFFIYWEFHNPNWLSYFSEGLKPTTNQGNIIQHFPPKGLPGIDGPLKSKARALKDKIFNVAFNTVITLVFNKSDFDGFPNQ
jgi:hypothetical protein